MSSRIVHVPAEGRPLLDLFSGGRTGPRARDRFTSAEIEQIGRTVRRAPEVMVRGGPAFSDTGISGFLSGHDRREVHAKAET